MASTSQQKKKIILKSQDNESFEVDEEIALQSQMMKKMLEDVSSNDPIPLPNVTAAILAKVVEYCKVHVDKLLSEDDVKQWDADFLNNIKVDQDILFDILLAANYLDIKNLQDLTCKCVADMMKGKTPQQIRDEFYIINDYSPEEEEAIKKEYPWAFDKVL